MKFGNISHEYSDMYIALTQPTDHFDCARCRTCKLFHDAAFCHLSFLSSVSGGGSCELDVAPRASALASPVAASSSSLRRRIRCLYLISARFTVMSVCPVSMSCNTRMMKSMNVSGAEKTALMKVPLLSKYICRANDSQCARQKSLILSARNTSRPACIQSRCPNIAAQTSEH